MIQTRDILPVAAWLPAASVQHHHPPGLLLLQQQLVPASNAKGLQKADSLSRALLMDVGMCMQMQATSKGLPCLG